MWYVNALLAHKDVSSRKDKVAEWHADLSFYYQHGQESKGLLSNDLLTYLRHYQLVQSSTTMGFVEAINTKNVLDLGGKNPCTKVDLLKPTVRWKYRSAVAGVPISKSSQATRITAFPHLMLYERWRVNACLSDELFNGAQCHTCRAAASTPEWCWKSSLLARTICVNGEFQQLPRKRATQTPSTETVTAFGGGSADQRN